MLETNRDVSDKIVAILKAKGIGGTRWFSGNKSQHIHIWFGAELAQIADDYRTRAKKAWVRAVLPKPFCDDIDESNLGKKTLIGLEHAPHRKTGKTKTLLESWGPERNVFPASIIDVTRKVPTPIVSLKNTGSQKIGSCLVCLYALENKLPEGRRNNALIPNFLALSPTREQIEQFAQTQGFSIQQVDAWDSCSSYKGEFNCVQLQRFAQKADLDLCSMCPRSGLYGFKK
ncbi:MAG: hypothetical protein Q7R47_05550 [Candidatus Diapherotrites archaeon]|nr:hypothetical protein [Candidatus Diapherotrites archaeon]